MSQPASDDSFREIQLSGKQLVFVFMAATVVSVVIFLCGVLVGRGVRLERAQFPDPPELALTPLPAQDPAPGAQVAIGRSVDSDPTKAAAPQAVEDLSYFSRLEQHQPVKETLKPATNNGPLGRAGATRVDGRPPALKRPDASSATLDDTPLIPAAPRHEPAPPSLADPAASKAFAVQVAALNDRGDADGVAKRLTAKGYSAYVLSATDGSPRVFRVRVGSFKTRREAELMAARLEREEHIKPWITR